MLRAGAQITGYEIREDFLSRALSNVSRFLGPEVLDRYDTHVRDVYAGISATDLDRVVLDLPRTVAGRNPRGTGTTPGRHLRGLHTKHYAGRSTSRRARKLAVRYGSNNRSAQPWLARCRPGCPSRSSDGRSHRILDQRQTSQRVADLLDFNENALAGALFGGFDCRLFETIRNHCKAVRPARVCENRVAFPDVGEAIVEKSKDIGGDLFAETVSGAKILIDPNLHESLRPRV